jgi:hypothetical protein
VDHFLVSVNDMFEHVLQDVGNSDMMGIAIHNEISQNDRPIGITFRRRDQLSGDMIWSMFEKVHQSNARFNYLDASTVVVHLVRMPIRFGRSKSKSRRLLGITHLKKSIIVVKVETYCLAPALDIAIVKVTHESNYNGIVKLEKHAP